MTKLQIIERHKMQRQAKKAYYNRGFSTSIYTGHSLYNDYHQRATTNNNNLLFSTLLLAFASTMFNR
jgi:hypothetical protein